MMADLLTVLIEFNNQLGDVIKKINDIQAFCQNAEKERKSSRRVKIKHATKTDWRE